MPVSPPVIGVHLLLLLSCPTPGVYLAAVGAISVAQGSLRLFCDYTAVRCIVFDTLTVHLCVCVCIHVHRYKLNKQLWFENKEKQGRKCDAKDFDSDQLLLPHCLFLVFL